MFRGTEGLPIKAWVGGSRFCFKQNPRRYAGPTEDRSTPSGEGLGLIWWPGLRLGAAMVEGQVCARGARTSMALKVCLLDKLGPELPEAVHIPLVEIFLYISCMCIESRVHDGEVDLNGFGIGRIIRVINGRL